MLHHVFRFWGIVALLILWLSACGIFSTTPVQPDAYATSIMATMEAGVAATLTQAAQANPMPLPTATPRAEDIESNQVTFGFCNKHPTQDMRVFLNTTLFVTLLPLECSFHVIEKGEYRLDACLPGENLPCREKDLSIVKSETIFLP